MRRSAAWRSRVSSWASRPSARGVLAVALDVPVLMPLMLVSVVLALVLGIAARRRVRRGGGRVRGSGLADWAIVLGSLGLLLALILPMT